MASTALRRQEDGSYETSLRSEWKELIAFCGKEVHAILESNSEVGRRLTPEAHTGDPEAQKEFEDLIGTELSEQRTADVEMLIRLPDAKELNSEEVESCIRGLTVIRQIYADFLGMRTAAETKVDEQVLEEAEDAEDTEDTEGSEDSGVAEDDEESHLKEYVLSPLNINKKSFSQPFHFYKQIYGPLAALQEQFIKDYVAAS